MENNNLNNKKIVETKENAEVNKKQVRENVEKQKLKNIET